MNQTLEFVDDFCLMMFSSLRQTPLVSLECGPDGLRAWAKAIFLKACIYRFSYQYLLVAHQ